MSSLKLILIAYTGQTHATNGASKAPMVSPNYREEAERIVAEEKASGEKMPVYEVRHSDDCKEKSSLTGIGSGGFQIG